MTADIEVVLKWLWAPIGLILGWLWNMTVKNRSDLEKKPDRAEVEELITRRIDPVITGIADIKDMQRRLLDMQIESIRTNALSRSRTGTDDTKT